MKQDIQEWKERRKKIEIETNSQIVHTADFSVRLKHILWSDIESVGAKSNGCAFCNENRLHDWRVGWNWILQRANVPSPPESARLG